MKHCPPFAIMVSLVLTSLRSAYADADGAYGRLSDVVELDVGAGPAVSSNGWAGMGILRALYLGMAGGYARISGGGETTHFEPAMGVTIRPAFLPRWGLNREVGPAWLDLTLDSIGIELGTVLPSLPPPRLSMPSFELGTGFELPLLGTRTGPWVGACGRIRWDHSAMSQSTIVGGSEAHPSIEITLAWHQGITSHAVDLNDTHDRTALSGR